MADLFLESRLARVETELAYLDLCSRYVHGVDKQLRDLFIDCWTEDAAWNLGPEWGNHVGREAILANWETLNGAFHEMHDGTGLTYEVLAAMVAAEMVVPEPPVVDLLAAG